MRKIRPNDLIYEHNCVTVPLFFTPRAQAAQARMQLASPVNIINTKKITKYGMLGCPESSTSLSGEYALGKSALKSH